MSPWEAHLLKEMTILFLRFYENFFKRLFNYFKYLITSLYLCFVKKKMEQETSHKFWNYTLKRGQLHFTVLLYSDDPSHN